MRCYRILGDVVFGRAIELQATNDDDAIAEASEIAIMRDWSEFEVYDGERMVHKKRAASIPKKRRAF